MQTVPQAEPKSQETISDAEFNRRYSECKVAPDVAQQIFALAGVPPRARDVLLALRVILRPGETRKVSRAAMAKRLNRDDTTASRHLDALQKYQQESGFQFVILERCLRHEKKSPIITDIWDALLRCALRTAVRAGEELNVWETGAGVAQPALLAREALAQKVFEQIPRQEPTTAAKTHISPEEQARAQVARAETRSRDLFADLEKHAEIVPFAVIAELARLEKLIPQLLAKTNRRAQDFAFAERFGSAEREEGVVIHVAENETETEGVPDPDMCKMHMSDEANKEVIVDFGENHEAPEEPEWLQEVADQDGWEADPRNNFLEPPTPAEMLKAALKYAAQGRRMVPLYGRNADCVSPGKAPWLTDWPNQATTDTATIESWWRRKPDSNLGWAMGGEEGIGCLDFDGEEGDALYWEMKAAGLLPPTLEQKTPRGRHVIYKNCPNFKNNVRVAPGLDVRSQGGQIVCEPSWSQFGPYVWAPGLQEPVDLPPNTLEWLEEKFAKLKKPPQQAAQQEPRDKGYSPGVSLSRIPKGERNNRLFGYLSGRRNSIADESAIRSIAYQVNQEWCDPPMGEAELEKIITQVCRYQPVLA